MSCRKEPLCKLGSLCKKVEIQGCSVEELACHYHGRYYDPTTQPNQYDMVIVLSGPSQEDEASALPVSGELLNIFIPFIEKAGIDPKKTWLTYLVKCAAPPKRTASVKEMNTCRQNLLVPEIQRLKPLVVMLLGSQSLRAFNLHNKGKISHIHGTPFHCNLPGATLPDGSPDETTYTIVPSVSPHLFLMRPNPQQQQLTVDDYRNAQQALTGTVSKDPTFANFQTIHTLDDLDKMIAEIKEQGAFAFDTESIRLPWSKHLMLCMSFCWGYPRKSAVLPFYTHNETRVEEFIKQPIEDEDNLPEEPIMVDPVWPSKTLPKIFDRLATIFESETIIKYAQNIKYDCNVLRKWAIKADKTPIRLAGFWLDTMILHHLLSEEGSHALEDLADEEFGYGDYSAAVRAIVGHGKDLIHGYDWIPDYVLHPYAATDAEAVWRLVQKYYNRLHATKPHLWQLYCKESEPLLHALADAEWYGHKIDFKVVDTLKVEYTARQDELLSNMRGVTHPAFNPLSHPQVKEAFINLGYEELITDEDAASGYRADKATLLDIQETVPLAAWLLEYRTNRKILSTYLLPARQDADEYGRNRQSWKQLTATGRLACKFFHQIPKINNERLEKALYNLRDMFIVEDDYDMVYADYSQVELWIMAIESNDAEMLRLLSTPGADLHGATTYEFLQPYIPGYTEEEARNDKENRAEVGKRVNFGLAYGSEGHAIVKTGKWKDRDGLWHPFTYDMLDVGMGRWRARFPGVSAYRDAIIESALNNNGIVYNAFFRERRLGNRLKLENIGKRKAAEREAVNFPIQSTAGSITNRTIILVYQYVRQLIAEGKLNEGDVRLINTVHDSIAFEVKKYLTNWFKLALRVIGERPIPELSNYTFKMDIGVGRSWTEAELAEEK